MGNLLLPQVVQHTDRRRVTPGERVKVNVDRPGWIPPEITDGWNPNPYAYQTEAELMPGGGLHGNILFSIMR